MCHMAQVAQDSRCCALYVVVGADADALRRALVGHAARIVENADWASGLASSIRAGIAAIASHASASDSSDGSDPSNAFDAAVVLLADQPHVNAEHIDALLDAYERSPDSLVASRYAGVEGVPALFPRRCFGDLARLEGDAGARTLLRVEGGPVEASTATDWATSAKPRVVAVCFEPAATDIDSPEDYAALLDANSRHG